MPPDENAELAKGIARALLDERRRRVKAFEGHMYEEEVAAVVLRVLNENPRPEPPRAIPEPTPAERIYSAYPRRVARKNAMKAIANALAAVPFEKLLAATVAYAEAVTRWTPDDRAKFVPHPATWFNRESYLDDPKAWDRKPVRTEVTDYSKI